MATDSAGRVSHAYLNQIEGGLPVAVTLPKLLSLAAVYNTPAQAIIAQLPEPLLSQRLANLESWHASGRAVPKPLPRIPERNERTDVQLDELFAKRARGFTVPWGEWKSATERAARDFLPYAILPAFIESSPGLAGDFWKLHPSRDVPQVWTVGRAGSLALIPHSPWIGIVNEFVEWATRATGAIVAGMRLVSWWTLDFSTSGASCHFASPEFDARYGFDSVPPDVAIAVRGWQLARLLFQHGAPQTWPPPPDPTEGARAFVEYLLKPQPFLPELAPDKPLTAAVIYAALSALARRVPELRATTTQIDASLLEGIASLLRRAAATDHASTVRKRGRPQRRA